MKTQITIAIFIILVVVFSTPSGLLAQGPETLSNEDLNRFSTSKVIRTVTSTDYHGSPYLNTDWQQGHIMINSRAKSQQLRLRFNAHENQVEFIENETVYAIPSNNLSGFVIYTTDGDMVFKNGYVSNEHEIDKKTLLRIIYEGKVKFLAHHKVLLRDKMQAYGSAVKQKEFVNVDNYFLVDEYGNFNKLKKLKKKDILKALGGDDKKLQDYAHSKNLSFKEESDLRLILQYYDSM